MSKYPIYKLLEIVDRHNISQGVPRLLYRLLPLLLVRTLEKAAEAHQFPTQVLKALFAIYRL